MFLSAWTLFTLLYRVFAVELDSAPSQLDNKIKSLRDSLQHPDTYVNDDNSIALHWENLGNLLFRKQGQNRNAGHFSRLEAIEAFSRASELSKSNANLQLRANLQKARIYTELGLEKEAQNAFENALNSANSPLDEAFVMYHQGKSLGTFGRHQDAVTLLEKTLKLSPTFLAAYLPLVNSYRFMGVHKSDRWDKLQKEIAQKMKKSTIMEVELKTETNGLSVMNVDPSRQQSGDVYWAQFLIADRLNTLNDAWDFLNQSQQLIYSKTEPYVLENIMSQTRSIKSVFKKEFWPDPTRQIGSTSNVPIFIVGMPRSGASVLESMLSAHSEIYGLGDSSIFSEMFFPARNALVKEWAQSTQSIKLRSIVEHHSNHMIRVMKDALRNDTSVTDVKKKSVLHIIDKPMSSYRTIGVIHYLFPKSIIINMNRDPLDIILSQWTNHVTDNETTVYAAQLSSIVEEYIQYLQVMDHYRNSLPDQLIDVSYEALVTDPRTALKPVLKKLGVAWEPTMLDFHKQKRHVKLHSRAQLLTGLTDASIGRWRKYVYQLLPTILYLRTVLPIAKEKGFLAFPKTMNWQLDEYFEYPKMKMLPLAQAAKNETVSDGYIPAAVIEKKMTSKKKKQKNNKDKNNNKSKKRRKTNSSVTKSVSKEARQNERVDVAFIVPVTSIGIDTLTGVDGLPLFLFLIPSLARCMTNESEWADLTMYLGYDEGDAIYDNKKNIKTVKSKITSMVPEMEVKDVRLVGLQGTIAHIWNHLISAAYVDGKEYFVILSDDAVVTSAGWLHGLVDGLKSATLIPNFGTVAFYEEHKKSKHGTYPTFPVLHKIHLEIFGKDYAIHPYFANSYSDPYLSDIYIIFRSAKIIEKARIKNSIGGEEAPRYNPSFPYINYIELVLWGRKRIAKWLAQAHPEVKDTWSVTGFQYGREALLFNEFCVQTTTVGCTLEMSTLASKEL